MKVDKEKLLSSFTFDTMLAHHLLDENDDQDLKSLTWKFEPQFGGYEDELTKAREKVLEELNEAKKAQGDKNKLTLDDITYDMIPEEILWKYAGYDTDMTIRHKKRFEILLEKEGLTKYFKNLSMPLNRVLTKMELNGIKIDRKKLDETIDDFNKRIAEVEKEVREDSNVQKVQAYLNRIGREEIEARWNALKKKKYTIEEYVQKYMDKEKYEFNINSTTNHLQILFFKCLKLQPIDFTDKPDKKTGERRAKLDKKILATYAKQHPLAGKIQKYRTLGKFCSTFLIGIRDLIGKDGRLHTSFLQHGTKTGRLSSSSPNLQNIPKRANDYVDPKEIRAIFIPEDECSLVEVDFAQLEFRIFAEFSGDKKLINDIKNGLDIHRHVASYVYECTEDEVTKDQRRKAKDTVFGLLYGEGTWGLSLRLEIEQEVADKISKYFFSLYPIAYQWLEKMKKMASVNGYTKTHYGRKRRLPFVLAFDKKLLYKKRRDLAEDQKEAVQKYHECIRQMVNHIIQGTASELTNLSLVRLQKRIDTENLPVKLMIQIHDAIVSEVNDDFLEKWYKILDEEMLKSKFETPLGIEIESGKRWSELKPIEQ